MPAKKSPKTEAGKPLVQEQFIAHFKKVLPPGLGLAEEMADILDISIDSAYRRIRGETEITLNEIYKICRKYTISIDEVFSNRSDTVTFAYTKLTDSVANFENYLLRLIGHLQNIAKTPNSKIYYVAEETPLFYSFFTRKLAEFKLFYWQRSVLNIEAYQKTSFYYGVIPERLVDLAHNSFKEYNTVASVEIWTDETVLTALRQVKFYFDSGILTKDLALDLLAEVRTMIEMIRRNAETGRKNISDQHENFTLYNSEVVLGTNCIYIVMGEARYSYITFNTLNSLTTNNPEFCEETEHWVRNLERKSTLISGVSEKQRYQFFNTLAKHVDAFVEQVKNA